MTRPCADDCGRPAQGLQHDDLLPELCEVCAGRLELQHGARCPRCGGPSHEHGEVCGACRRYLDLFRRCDEAARLPVVPLKEPPPGVLADLVVDLDEAAGLCEPAWRC